MGFNPNFEFDDEVAGYIPKTEKEKEESNGGKNPQWDTNGSNRNNKNKGEKGKNDSNSNDLFPSDESDKDKGKNGNKKEEE